MSKPSEKLMERIASLAPEGTTVYAFTAESLESLLADVVEEAAQVADDGTESGDFYAKLIRRHFGLEDR